MKRILAIILAVMLFTAAIAEPLEGKRTPSGIPCGEIGAETDAHIAEREAGPASCAVSVFDADDILFTGCYGFADIENGVRADEETVCEFIYLPWEQGCKPS